MTRSTVLHLSLTAALLCGCLGVAVTMNQPASARPGDEAPPEHPELGRVAWGRDYPAAQAESARTGKPILLLFDEVPG
jgi:hypothetical protein